MSLSTNDGSCLLIVPNIIMCGTGYRALRRVVRKCWGACGIEDAPIAEWENSPWYGPDWICAICGDSWCVEGLNPRPFQRGWRQKAIAKAHQLWEAACECGIDRDDDYYPVPCEHDRARHGR